MVQAHKTTVNTVTLIETAEALVQRRLSAYDL
jgi:hypothetical protein